MSWKFVANIAVGLFENPHEAAGAASKLGYKFFTWGQSVYFISDKECGRWIDTGIKTSDLTQ
jgi:hypothetical protein